MRIRNIFYLVRIGKYYEVRVNSISEFMDKAKIN